MEKELYECPRYRRFAGLRSAVRMLGESNHLLTFLEGSVHATDLILSLRPKFNFVLTETNPRKFKKSMLKLVAKAA